MNRGIVAALAAVLAVQVAAAEDPPKRIVLPWPGTYPSGVETVVSGPDAGCSVVTGHDRGTRFSIEPDGTAIQPGDYLGVRALDAPAVIKVNGRAVAHLEPGQEWVVTPWKTRLTVDATSPVAVRVLRAARPGTPCDGAGTTTKRGPA